MKKFSFILFSLIFIAGFQMIHAQETFTFEDVMKFEDIKTPAISANGEWVVFGVWPELGDGEVRIKSVNGSLQFTIERGESPQISSDGKWAGAIVKPPFIEAENAGRDAPKNELKLLNTSTGETREFENVRQFSFSNDGRWAIIHHHQTEDVEDGDFKNPHIGTPVRLVQLETDTDLFLPFVNASAMDSTSAYFAYATVDTASTENGFFAIDLGSESPNPQKILGNENAYFTNLTWDHSRSRIAFTEALLDTAQNYFPSDASIKTWAAFEGEPETLLTPDDAETGYRLRSTNSLTWTYDGTRLFYGVKQASMVELDETEAREDSVTTENLYNVDRILAGVEGKVWHWDDPMVKTHEKQTWNSRKNHLYMAVYHLDEKRSVQLATTEMPNVSIDHHSGKLLGSSDLPYLKLITWDGRYSDFYLVDQSSGEAEQFIEKQRFGATVSPNGKFAAWFSGTDWMLKSTETGEVRNLTETIGVPFADEDNDRPMPSGSYGIAGWTDGDTSVLIYDKYDIWQFDTSTGDYLSITDGTGRDEMRIFRIRDLNPDNNTFESNERLLLTMYHDWDKNYGFYEARVGRSGVSRTLEDDKRFNIVALASDDDAILFTQETYTEYPNLWVASDRRFRNPVQISNLHEDLTERFAWGHAELVEWLNMDGRTVQGILYYPGDYEPGKRYPVFIYYYERFSQRLYEFNTPVTNHRPNIAQYTSDGYAVFLPDIWFDVPIPGYSATKNLVPGVQKLVEMGIADPDAIGLHGHSWSGYLTAQVVTQTDIFAAAIAGAPVGNMTSAYSGIRWGTGLARQFQYEQAQSRLGVSMWENLSPYIENSPVFYADRINTPLMIQHGDADEAVPWYQSIELYLALRRLGKESVFLHYYDEPHHLRNLANRLDYAIKMKEYMDHYLKGTPAPAWISDGVPYLGE
ncbi:MAG: S9 family peptidase [Balneolaceae bacterium]|nr:S9 family peptidase [Balneolaceae bacterium]